MTIVRAWKGNTRAAWPLLAMLLALAGCGGDASLPELHAVAGTITQGGKPVANALLRLTATPPDIQLTVTGVTDASGRYELSTFSAAASSRQPGAPAGTYQVVIDLPVDVQQAGGGTVRWPEPLTVPVAGGRHDFNLDANVPSAPGG